MSLLSPLLSPRYLFTSREYDTATGLQYNRARWYDAEVGRWISEDPLGFRAGDTNIVRYVGSHPINRRDPSGLQDAIPYDVAEDLAKLKEIFEDVFGDPTAPPVDFTDPFAQPDALDIGLGLAKKIAPKVLKPFIEEQMHELAEIAADLFESFQEDVPLIGTVIEFFEENPLLAIGGGIGIGIGIVGAAEELNPLLDDVFGETITQIPFDLAMLEFEIGPYTIDIDFIYTLDAEGPDMLEIIVLITE